MRHGEATSYVTFVSLGALSDYAEALFLRVSGGGLLEDAAGGLWQAGVMNLSPVELRVLGALIEKEITTPEYYPLSLNALLAASNQRSSRDPVMELSEEEVRQALHGLEDLGLVSPTRDARVSKWEHHARTVLNLRRDETAVLALLLLRGPQTPGEIRSRADRLYSFDDLPQVTSTLDRMAGRSPAAAGQPMTPEATGPLTAVLARQPGARESRYMHLLGGDVPAGAATGPGRAGSSPVGAGSAGASGSDGERMVDLERTVEGLLADVRELKARVDLLDGGSREGFSDENRGKSGDRDKNEDAPV